MEENGEKNGGKKRGKKSKRLMKIVATTSLPAVDRPNADRWNVARSCQKHSLRKFRASCEGLQVRIDLKHECNGPKFEDKWGTAIVVSQRKMLIGKLVYDWNYSVSFLD